MAFQEAPPLDLYHMTLVPPRAVSTAVVGCFESPKHQLVVAAHHQTLAVYSATKDGLIQKVFEQQFFTTIAAIATIPAATNQLHPDYLAVTTDSGYLVALELEHVGFSYKWIKLASIMIGKSGLRRTVPGHYLAVDPQGRCLMVAALERQKLVVPIRQDVIEADDSQMIAKAAAGEDGEEEFSEKTKRKLVFGSPMEANKAAVIHDCVAVDTDGTGNPLFACIEATADAVVEGNTFKQVAYYEYDVGLHTVIRSWSMPVSLSANKLIPLPGGNFPSGVVVCGESEVTWVHNRTGSMTLRQVIPRREDMKYESGELYVQCYAMVKSKDNFFLLAQSEVGDLYRVDMNWTTSMSLSVRYFDTVPVASALVLLRRGQMFSFSESGKHHLYRILKDGFTNDSYIKKQLQVPIQLPTGEIIERIQPLFKRHELTNLRLVDTLENISPLLQVDYIPRGTAIGLDSKFVAVQGRAHLSAFSVIRQGRPMAFLEIFTTDVSFDTMWPTTLSEPGEVDSHLVLTSGENTIVLRVEANSNGTHDINAESRHVLNTEIQSIAVTPLALNSGFAQIHTRGVRHMVNRETNEWKHSIGRSITHAAVNCRQFVVAFAAGGISYFELNPSTRKPDAIGEELTVPSPVLSITMPPVSSPDELATFVGVAFEDRSFRFYSLGGSNNQRLVPLETVPCQLRITSTAFIVKGGLLIALIGLEDGSLVYVHFDRITGAKIGLSTVSCGSTAVQLVVQPHLEDRCYAFCPATQQTPCCLWYCGVQHGGFHYEPVVPSRPIPSNTRRIVGFASKNGHLLMAMAGSDLEVFRADRHDERFVATHTKLPMMARKHVLHPSATTAVVMATEHRGMTIDAQKALSKLDADLGRCPEPRDTFVSSLQVVDLRKPQGELVGQPFILPQDITALCIAIGTFTDFGRDPVIVVGAAQAYKQNPVQHDGGVLIVYRFSLNSGGQPLEYVHMTPILDDIPTSLHLFNGYLLVGHAHKNHGLQLFGWGKKQLLKKAKLATFESSIVHLTSNGPHIAVGDAASSVFFVRYQERKDKSRAGSFPGQLIPVADDVTPRRMTTCCFTDSYTVAVGDKFGNICILRLPPDVASNTSASVDEEGWEEAVGPDCMHIPKVHQVNSFHVGDVITSLSMIVLPSGGPTTPKMPGNAIMYSTIQGAVGVLKPFRTDAEFIQMYNFQNIMRRELEPLLGCEHHFYRSRFYQTSKVIDGDYLEQFYNLTAEERNILQKLVIKELNKANKVLQNRGEAPRNFDVTCDEMLKRCRSAVEAL